MTYAVPTTEPDKAVRVVVKVHYKEDITVGDIILIVAVFLAPSVTFTFMVRYT